MKFLVQYSGGKDSLATLLYVMEHYNNDKIEVVFCDTGWEHIPAWACKNGEYPTIQDVVKYVQDNPDQLNLIEKEVQSCKSIYNICE